MKTSVMLRRIIGIVLMTVVLSSALTALIYFIVAQTIFVHMRADELLPNARSIAELIASSEINADNPPSLPPLFGRLGADVHIYTAEGEELSFRPNKPDKSIDQPADNDGKQHSEGMREDLNDIIKPQLTKVLKGQEIQSVQSSSRRKDYLIIGVPVKQDGAVTGAVVLTKPISELSTALSGLNITLLISMLISFGIMLVPGYIAARKLVVPIRQMNDVSVAMRKGDFSVRADETQKGEIGELAQSINLFAEESEALERTRRDYVANVSHELRTPIAGIRAMSETLRDGLVPEDQKDRYYQNILRESMRLSRLVDDLLELSRLQSGNIALQKQEFAVRPLLENIADMYGGLAADVGVSFVFEADDDPMIAHSNPDRIEQVVVILLDNAVKHTPDGGCVTLMAHLNGDRILVTVKDTGDGIPKEHIEHIFERFYKVDTSHSTGGTGLGLSIASEVLTMLGESIEVESEPENGTTFVFTIHTALEDMIAKE